MEPFDCHLFGSETLFFHRCRQETRKSGQTLPCCSLKHFLLGIQTLMPLKWIVKFRNSLKNSMYVFHVVKLPVTSALSAPGAHPGPPPVTACVLPLDGKLCRSWLSSSKYILSLGPSVTSRTKCPFLFPFVSFGMPHYS